MSGSRNKVKNRIIQSNVSFMKRYYEDKRDGEEVTANMDTTAVEPQPKSDTKPVTPETVTRPSRERRSPAYLKDYIR